MASGLYCCGRPPLQARLLAQGGRLLHRQLLLRRQLGGGGCCSAGAATSQSRQLSTQAAAAAQAAAPAAASASPSPNKQASPRLQTLDYTALAACCHELATGWLPSKVEEVVQPDRYTLALRLRTPLQQGWLHLSWHPAAARVCIGRPPARGDVSEAFSLAATVSAQLKGLVLLDVQLPAGWERVAQLDFGSRPGEPPSRRLYCEVMAKYSNVVLTDGSGEVQQAAYQVGSGMSSLRQVQQGRSYQLPPRLGGIAPAADEPPATWQENITRGAALALAERQQQQQQEKQRQKQKQGSQPPQPAVASVLAGATRAYMGVSPALVEELCQQAGVSPSAQPAELSPDAWRALHAGWRAWIAALQERRFAASSCPATRRFSVLPAASYEQPHESVHAMIDAYYFSSQAGEVYAALHQRLSTGVRHALKKARGRVTSFEQQLEAAQDADGLQRRGDIIVANLYRIEPGAAQLEAEDWDTGEALVLPLDPLKAPMEVAEGLFRRARKLRRAVDAVGPLLEVARQELDYLESVELELSQLPPGGAEQELSTLRQVEEELVEARVIRAPPEAALAAKAASKGRKAAKRAAKAGAGGGGSPASAAVAAAAGGAGLRQYESPGGLTVLVGRNNKQNDVLSHQVAKPGDVWMHVRGLPGSHTVLRLAPGREPEQADLQFAADLAAWFSKAREAGKVDVIVARAQHLKKPRGAKPGQVLVTQEERNIVARPGASVAAAAAAAGGDGS